MRCPTLILRSFLCLSLCSVGACGKEEGGRSRIPINSGRYINGSGQLMAGATDHVLEVDREAGTAIVTFSVDKVRYRATYRLSEDVYRYSSFYLALTSDEKHAACAAALDEGPKIDAVHLRRGGKLIATVAQVVLASQNDCLPTGGTSKLQGPSDGEALPLGYSTLRLRFERYARPLPGDEIVVFGSGRYKLWIGIDPPDENKVLGTGEGKQVFPVTEAP